MKARFRRSHTDRMISGVCGGLAEYSGLNSTFIRILFLIFTFIGLGAPILIYFVLALVMQG